MASTRFTVHTSLSPNEVMELFTDFGPERANRWPNIDDAHFNLHDSGPGWAEVTEGNALGWERERYSWDSQADTITIDTLDSNLWGPGSGWRYELEPATSGTGCEGHLDPHGQVIPGQVGRSPDPRSWSLDPGKAIPIGAGKGRGALTLAGRQGALSTDLRPRVTALPSGRPHLADERLRHTGQEVT
jgi:hypothetical protein